MTRYIGTKIVRGTPMTRGEYNKLQGWDLPEGQDASDTGYLVEYRDGGAPNHPDYEGYISWSPSEVFEDSYRVITGNTFGAAIEALKAGNVVAREGWNGKGMFLIYVGADEWSSSVLEQPGLQGFYDRLPWIAMKTADGKIVPWLASQTDILADDWVIH